MRISRGGDGSGFDEPRKLVERAGRAHLILLRDLRRLFRVGIVDCGEIRNLRFGIKPCMIFPDVTHAHDSHPESFHVRVGLEKISRMPEGGSQPQS